MKICSIQLGLIGVVLASGCAAISGDDTTESGLTVTYRWTAVTNGVTPPGAYIGGQEPGNTLGVCIAANQNGTHGGKLINGVCNIGWGGTEVSLRQYQALTDVTPGTDVWVAGSNGSRPADALLSGKEGNTQQYVCRASYSGGTHPGKLLGNNCNIGWGGKEIELNSYEVLALRSPPTGGADMTMPGPPPLIWPNDAHSANSDPWIAQHHDEITEMHPRALLINFANNRAASAVTDRWKLMSDGMSEGSRYHGYSDPSAKPFVIHQLVKLVDLTDNPVPQGWTFPNSTKMPRLNGGIDFAQLYNQKYADYYAIPDPKNPGHNLTLCEMLQKGVINELFIAFNKTGSDGNVPEIIEYKQSYDDHDVAIPNHFEPWAGNGAFDPPDLPEARACGISLRVDFLEMTGNISGALHVLSHNFDHIGDSAVPNYKKFYHPLMNRDFDKRFNTPFADWYGITVNGSMTNFITYNGNNSVTWTCPADTGCAGKSGTMNPFDQGCGNTHYAANSRNSYDMANSATVLTRCEHYGLHDGPGGKDLQTPFNSSTWGQYGQKYGNDGNGGGWQIYLFQSFPGYHNKATLPDGTKIKNLWPYLYY